MSNEYNNWMNKTQGKVTISLSPSKERIAEITALCNPREDYKGFEKLYGESIVKTVYEGISLREAQAIAEPLRIANPDQCVNIYADDNSYIGNTSWSDQLKMFFEYPTFTPEGAAIMKARQEEAAKLGIVASWE